MFKILSSNELNDIVHRNTDTEKHTYALGSIIHEIAEAERKNTLQQVYDKIVADMPSLTRYGALQYIRDLAQELQKRAER